MNSPGVEASARTGVSTSVTSNNDRLPLEILGNIFTEAFESSNPKAPRRVRLKDVKNLRLVCKQFSRAGKILLFSSVHVRGGMRGARNKIFFNNLLDAENDAELHLRECVRSITWHHKKQNDSDGVEIDIRFPELHCLVLEGGGLDRAKLALGVRSYLNSVWSEDPIMHRIVNHHLNISTTLTSLDIVKIKEVPLHLILASPSLAQLIMVNCTIRSIFSAPSPHDLEKGYNIIVLCIKGGDIPPMTILRHLTKLTDLAFLVTSFKPLQSAGRPFLDIGEEYVPIPFRRLQSLTFEGDLEDFNCVFSVDEAYESGVDIFPEVKMLELIDTPKDRVHVPSMPNYEDYRRWLGEDKSRARPRFSKLEELKVDLKFWYVENRNGVHHISMYKNLVSIFKYLGIPTCTMLESVYVVAPYLLMSTTHTSNPLHPANMYRVFVDEVKELICLLEAVTTLYPTRRRVTSRLREVDILYALGPPTTSHAVYTSVVGSLAGPSNELRVLMDRHLRGVELTVSEFEY